MEYPAFAGELLSEEEVPDRLYDRTLRRRIRYVMSRLKTEADGGAEMEDVPEGFNSFFEDQEWFDGWENWGVTWDVGKLKDGNFLEVVPRWLSIHEEWEDVIQGELRTNEIAARKRRRMGNGSEGDL